MYDKYKTASDAYKKAAKFERQSLSEYINKEKDERVIKFVTDDTIDTDIDDTIQTISLLSSEGIKTIFPYIVLMETPTVPNIITKFSDTESIVWIGTKVKNYKKYNFVNIATVSDVEYELRGYIVANDYLGEGNSTCVKFDCSAQLNIIKDASIKNISLNDYKTKYL